MFRFRGSCCILYCAVVCFLIAATACNALGQAPAGNTTSLTAISPAAKEEMGKGLDALRAANYDEAIAHFRKAVALDPNSIPARFYLGFALSQNVIPGLTTPDNLKIAQEAIDAFKQVVLKAPQNTHAMREIAEIYFYTGRLDEARVWQKRVLSADPRDAEAAYTVGVIDWTQADRNVLAALEEAGFMDDGEGNVNVPAAVMRTIQAKNAPLVNEGLRYLMLALQQAPHCDDAMQYLNLMYRRKADLDRGDEKAREEDLATADAWMQKTKEAREAGEGGCDGGGGDLEDVMVLPPPPPPPPPQAGYQKPNGGSNSGVIGSLFGNGPTPKVRATPPKKVRISAGVAAGMLLEKTAPIYPPIAKAARVSGTVVLDATISKTGEVEGLQVISGPAMLRQAAMDAVKSWRYRPYLLNNKPVEVETTVNVIFSLGN